MRRVWIAALLTVLLCTLLSFSAQAEVTLKEYHAMWMWGDSSSSSLISGNICSVYKNGFRQYGQGISSFSGLRAYLIALGKETAVPTRGDVLLVFINNTAYLDQGAAGFLYKDSNSIDWDKVSLEKLKTALSAFPGRVVLIIGSPLQAAKAEGFRQALTATFSDPKYTLCAFLVNKWVGDIDSSKLCEALGYNWNGIKPQKTICADANKDRIVTAGELYACLQRVYGANATGVFQGSDLPVYFATPRISLSLPEKAHTLNGRESFTIVPIVEPAGATDFFVWSSSNKNVATVKGGVVTGVGPGKTTISLKADGKTLKMTVTVNKVSAVSAAIVPPERDVYVGDKVQLTVKMEPANATDTITSWSSSVKRVATVDKNGLLKALKDGQTVITVKTKQGRRLQCPITVKKIAVTSVTIERDSSSPEYGTAGLPKQYVAHVQPENASFPGLRWTSTNSAVASVSETGKVSCKKPGTATIRAASVDDASLYDEFLITVRANEHRWPAPVPADFAGMAAGLYQSPKRLYFSGSSLIAEVYLYNHANAKLKSIPPFYACIVDMYFYEDYPDEPESYLLYAKAKGRYTFPSPIAPERAGVYRFTVPVKKKFSLYAYPDYTPMLFGR